MFPASLSATLRGATLVLALAFGASGTALADDNSMSPLTGDSYAYFNGLVFTPGAFNVARAARTPADTGSTGSQESASTSATAARPANVEPAIERPTLLAARPTLAPSKTFDDGTGA